MPSKKIRFIKTSVPFPLDVYRALKAYSAVNDRPVYKMIWEAVWDKYKDIFPDGDWLNERIDFYKQNIKKGADNDNDE